MKRPAMKQANYTSPPLRRILAFQLCSIGVAYGWVGPTTLSLPNHSLCKLHRRQTCRHLFDFSSKNQEKNTEWEAGDVYADLALLEQGINLANAEQNLQHVERMELLKHMARIRYPLIPAVRKYILAPLALAWVWNWMSATKIPVLRACARGMTRLLNFHFWSLVVTAPMVLLLLRRILRRRFPPEPMPEELRRLERVGIDVLQWEDRKIYTDWEPSESSCRDNILVLLEYWTSAVVGMAAVGCLGKLVRMPTSPLIRMWWASAQLLTRLAAIASVHQMPNQLYQLQCPTHPRPVTGLTSILQHLIQSMSWIAPVAVASDLSRVLGCLSRDSALASYTSISLLLGGTWLRLVQQTPSPEDEDPHEFQRLKKRSGSAKVATVVALLVVWRKALSGKLASISAALRLKQRWNASPQRLLCFSALILGVGVLPLVGPVAHLLAIKRMFRIEYMHDFSLALDLKDFQAAMQNEQELERRVMWRYRLEWREDIRLGKLFDEWQFNIFYWLFLKGGFYDKVMKRRAEAPERTILDMVRDEEESGDSTDHYMSDRDTWKPRAMEKLAKKHQQDYEQGQYDDPLGVAVQQTFGIGLGFNFRHMQPLEEGEKPSLRRLQARAAKSAIKRVQELYNAEEASKILDSIKDPKERERKARAMRAATDKEVRHLAARLTELVPSGVSDSEFGDELQIMRYQMSDPQKWVRRGSHEYVYVGDKYDHTASLDELFHKFAPTQDGTSDKTKSDSVQDGKSAGTKQPSASVVEAYDDAGKDTLGNKEITSTDGEEEFVKALLDQQQGKRGPFDGDDDTEDDDSDDGDRKVVLA